MIDFIELNPTGERTLEDVVQILKLQLERMTTVPGSLLETITIFDRYVFSLTTNPYQNGLSIVNINTGSSRHYEFNPHTNNNVSKFINDIYNEYLTIYKQFEFNVNQAASMIVVDLLK